MDRRGFLSAMVGAPVMALTAAAVLTARQFPGQAPNTLPGTSKPSGQMGSAQLPNGQLSSGIPARQLPGQMPGADSQDGFPSPKLDPKAVLKDDQKKMVKDVEQLYDLAVKLRKQVNKTDSSEVLSLDLIHTTEEIEKLAKQVRDLARG